MAPDAWLQLPWLRRPLKVLMPWDPAVRPPSRTSDPWHVSAGSGPASGQRRAPECKQHLEAA
eukprot:7206805-Alexandrium_andersonii.AAC.1